MDPVTLVRAAETALTLLPVELVTQIRPWPSMATALGPLRPLSAEVPTPAGVKTLRVLLPRLGTQALPKESNAMAEGALRPPPV